MLEYLPEFLTIAGIHLLALASPGPDFVLVMNNSLIRSRRSGVYTALGLSIGMLIHVTYSLVGIGLIISQSIVVFNIVKFLGAGYLIYIGFKALISKKSNGSIPEPLTRSSDLSRSESINMGFITNVLNPKVTLFFLALFTQVISPETPLGLKIVYGFEMVITTFAWFSLVAYLFSHDRIRHPLQKLQFYIEKFMGAALVLLGVKVALSKN